MRGNVTLCSREFSQDIVSPWTLFPPTHRCKPQLMLSHLNKSYSQHKRHSTQTDKLPVVCFHRRWEGRKAHKMVLGMLTMSFKGKKNHARVRTWSRWALAVHGESGLGFCPGPLPKSLPLQAAVDSWLLTSPYHGAAFHILCSLTPCWWHEDGSSGASVFRSTSMKDHAWNSKPPPP